MPNVSQVAGVALGIFSLAASTVYAEGLSTDSRQPAISPTSIARAVAQSTASSRPSTLAPHSAARVQDTQNDVAGQPGQFFASPKGAVVLAVLGAGMAYAVYSKVHDRIHSKNPDR